MKTIELYTDGACKGNPGPGGWGALLRYQGIEKMLSGVVPHTTNNQMELRAAIEGLNAIKEPCVVNLWTDSQYLKKGITEWIYSWRKKNWRNSQGKTVKNVELWQELMAAVNRHSKVNWHWVKGHSGHSDNDRVDTLATNAIEEWLKNH